MDLVTGVDPLGAVAAEEVSVKGKTTDIFKYRYTLFFSGPRIYSRFINNNINMLEYAGYSFSGI